jgi:phosphoribosylaminoimidazole carboxylase (NCAIR synthetase)
MSFPTVGLIASGWAQGIYQSEANKLGIGIKFSRDARTADELIDFAKDCDILCIDPEIVEISAIKTAERAGVRVYPTSKTLEQLESIEKNLTSGDCISILIARSAHNQASSWPITLITDNLTITPLPGISDQQSKDIQLSALHLAGEIGLVGGLELLVDANNHKKLKSINWLVPKAKFWTQVNSTSNYFEQYLRAVLDLPLGNTEIINQFTVTGSLVTDPKSDNYRPYLHLMARNPNLKFDQSINQVAVSGGNLESLLTEVIHAQQYYSGEIEE